MTGQSLEHDQNYLDKAATVKTAKRLYRAVEAPREEKESACAAGKEFRAFVASFTLFSLVSDVRCGT